MLICLSGAYVQQELALQFGRLPPAFLPVGTERLFQLQHAQFARGEACRLSLPYDFEVDTHDLALLEELGIEIRRTDPSLSLCDAIASLISDLDCSEPVSLLFGDTLVDMPEGVQIPSDFACVKKTMVDYPWVYASGHALGDASGDDGPTRFRAGTSGAHGHAVCGYLGFSDVAALREAFRQPTLEGALNAYAQERGLQLVETQHWYDFGHLTLFYQSKRDLLVARAFNSLQSDGYSIVKTSGQTQKIRAEAEWYESLPETIVLHTPRYIGRANMNHKAGYRLEYLHVPTLADISVFGCASEDTWSIILSKCIELLKKFPAIQPDPAGPEAAPTFAQRFHRDIFIDKTWSRLRAFCDESGLPLDTRMTLNGHLLPPLEEIVTRILDAIPPPDVDDICFWHGDFFFGNLFFDFNAQRVIMIDPRGQLSDGSICHFGDRRYDIGKLAHSILGGYDSIIAGRSHLQMTGPGAIEFRVAGYDAEGESQLSRRFLSQVQDELGLAPQTVRALGAVMFFSMLPLHREAPDRQMRLLASGLTQYGLLER